MSDSEERSWFVLASKEGLAEAQAIARAWLDEEFIDVHIAHRILLALDELVANLVDHAALPEDFALFELRLSRQDDVVTLVVIDEGPAFDPLTAAVPPSVMSLDELAIGGRGLLLVRQLAHNITYAREDGFNEVTLEFMPAQTFSALN